MTKSSTLSSSKRTTTPDARKLPFSPEDLLDKTKENNQTLERLLQERKELEEKCRQLRKERDELDRQAEHLKHGCRGKLHSMSCPKMKRLEEVRDETLRLCKVIEKRAELYGYPYKWTSIGPGLEISK